MTAQSFVKSVIKFLAWVILIWVGLGVLMFWNLIFHDSSEIPDRVIDEMLGRTGFTRDEVEITHAHSDPPNWAGDTAYAFCVRPGAQTDRQGFVPGSTLNPEDSSLQLSDLIAQRVDFVPLSGALSTDNYAIRIFYAAFERLAYAFIATDENLICYVRIKI